MSKYNYCKWNDGNIAARPHLSFCPGRYLLLKVYRWASGNHRGRERRKRPGTYKQNHWTEVIFNPHETFGTRLQSNSLCGSKNIENNQIFFCFCTTCMVWKGRTGRRGATECRRMMNSQTGIKFHDWDSWAVMAVDQRSATPPSWVQPMAVRALFPTGSLRRRWIIHECSLFLYLGHWDTWNMYRITATADCTMSIPV